MGARTYRVKDVARLAKVTVRTLHHYDEIGLLVPSSRTESGYRLYAEEDLHRLQQILLWRELGFPLEEIRSILDDPDFDRKEALLAQRKELEARGRRTEAMIRSVDLALASLKGGKTMDAKKLFEGFDPSRYEDEARGALGRERSVPGIGSENGTIQGERLGAHEGGGERHPRETGQEDARGRRGR